MIQMQYREMTLEQKSWEVYGEATIITNDMKQAARDFRNNEHRFYEVRYVNTKANPELAL